MKMLKAIGDKYYDVLIARKRNARKRHKKYLKREAKRRGGK